MRTYYVYIIKLGYNRDIRNVFFNTKGCGKTSIYKSTYYEQNKDEKRINTDEMVDRIGSWKDSNQHSSRGVCGFDNEVKE